MSTKIDVTAAAHSTLGPSAAKRWMNCPGSVAIVATLPKAPSGYAAAEGIVAHKLHEQYHNGEIDGLELVSKIGTVVMQEGHEVEITEEMVDSAVDYHEAIKADIAQLEQVHKPMPVESLTEVKVHATSVDPRVWGTADKVVFRKGDTLIVRDLKFGKGVVEADENEQMALYAIGVMDELAGWAFSRVVLIIDQPRAPHEDGRERRWETTTAWLKEFAAKAKAAAQRTLDPNAEVVAGPWCQSSYCPARAICPAIHKQAQERAAVAFADPVPALLPEQTKSIEKRETAYKALRLPEVALMTDEQLVAAFKWREPINGFFEAVSEHLLGRHLAGKPVAGTKLVDGRSNRAWVSPEEVAQKFGEQAWERKLLSPAKLEAVVGKKAGVDAMTYKPEPKKIVVLASDARPEARVSAQEAFKDPVIGVDVGSPGGDKTVAVRGRREGEVITVSAVETSCPECDILGVCSRHSAEKKLWP
jgi:hypothetical protein